MKLKLLILAAFIFSAVSPVIAQIKVGVEAGVNFSHYLGTGDYTAKEMGGMKSGFQIGATVDYEMENHWMLMSGLSFLQNRGTLEIADHMVFYFPKTDIKINNLILPVKVGYNFHINDNLSFIPSVGPYASYAFSAGSCDMVIIHPTDKSSNPETVKWKPMSGYSYEPTQNGPASIPKHKHWDIGAIAGLKTVIYKNYTVSFSYSVGITQVFVRDLRNSNFQFSVGYTF